MERTWQWALHFMGHAGIQSNLNLITVNAALDACAKDASWQQASFSGSHALQADVSTYNTLSFAFEQALCGHPHSTSNIA